MKRLYSIRYLSACFTYSNHLETMDLVHKVLHKEFPNIDMKNLNKYQLTWEILDEFFINHEEFKTLQKNIKLTNQQIAENYLAYKIQDTIYSIEQTEHLPSPPTWKQIQQDTEEFVYDTCKRYPRLLIKMLKEATKEVAHSFENAELMALCQNNLLQKQKILQENKKKINKL